MSLNRVGIVLSNLNTGGAERQAVELAVRLPAYGWEPVMLVMEPEGPLLEQLRDTKVTVVNLGRDFRGGFWHPRSLASAARVFRRIRRSCRRYQLPIVHSFLFWESAFTVPAVRTSLRAYAMVTGRRNTGEYKDQRPHYQWIENAMNFLTDAVVANSQGVLRDCRRREAFLPRRQEVIPNGVDVEHFAGAAPRDLRTEFPALRGASHLLGTVGNLKRQKRHDLMIAAFVALLERYPGARLVIAGRDLGEEAALRALIAERGVAGKALLLGPVDDPAPLLRALDVFLLSSDHEGMPNVVLEAMAAGTPVVATDLPGVREIARHRRHALLVPRGDAAALAQAVGKVLASPERAEQLRRHALARVRKDFTYEAMVGRYAALYSSLLRREIQP